PPLNGRLMVAVSRSLSLGQARNRVGSAVDCTLDELVGRSRKVPLASGCVAAVASIGRLTVSVASGATSAVGKRYASTWKLCVLPLRARVSVCRNDAG